METKLDNTEINKEHLNIIARLFQYAETGKLDEINTNKYIMHIVNYATLPDDGSYKVRIKKFGQAKTNFLKKLEKTIKDAEKSADNIVKFMREENKRIEMLPELAEWDDDEKTVQFIKSLKKDLYNYSQAADALGCITRQTLTKDIRAGYLGIKHVINNRREYITKGDLIRIYRDKFPSDILGKLI